MDMTNDREMARRLLSTRVRVPPPPPPLHICMGRARTGAQDQENERICIISSRANLDGTERETNNNQAL